MIDREEIKRLAIEASSPLWVGVTPAKYLNEEVDDFTLICDRKCGFQWCRDECFEVRDKLAKERAIANFIVSVQPEVTRELGWNHPRVGKYHQPSSGKWFMNVRKLHPDFKSGPSYQVSTCRSAVCHIWIRKHSFLRTCMTVGRAEIEWANAAYIEHFSPGHVIWLLGQEN